MVWMPRLRHRATLARRDARFLWETVVRGRAPSPLVPRPASRRADSAPVVALRGGVSPRTLRIVRRVQETADAVSLQLTEADGTEIAHQAGQFLTLDVRVDGRRHRRAYSFSSPALPGATRQITIKRVEGGVVSNYLQSAEIKTLDVLGPSGAFVLPPGAKTLVLFAGGSGITPIISILETALRTTDATVHLFYGNRSAAETIFLDRLRALEEEMAGRLTVTHEWERLLDADTQRALLASLPVPDDATTHYFVCGPTPMMDASREALSHVPAARRHEERFTRPEDRTGAATLGPQPVQIRIQGATRNVQATTTLLEAGLQAGLDMPFSCAMGGCAACKVKLVDGEVQMDEPTCLTEAERDEGWVLACCSRAATPCTIEVP